MRYSKYLKDLGISYGDYFKLKYFNAISQTKELLKYGTNNHEMWILDIILAFEIYPRLKRLHDEYNEVNQFPDKSMNPDGTPKYKLDTKEGNEAYDKAAQERFDKVIYAFEMIIKIWKDPELEEFSKDCTNPITNPDSQYNKIQEGLKIFGEGFWGVGY